MAITSGGGWSASASTPWKDTTVMGSTDSARALLVKHQRMAEQSMYIPNRPGYSTIVLGGGYYVSADLSEQIRENINLKKEKDMKQFKGMFTKKELSELKKRAERELRAEAEDVVVSAIKTRIAGINETTYDLKCEQQNIEEREKDLDTLIETLTKKDSK